MNFFVAVAMANIALALYMAGLGIDSLFGGQTYVGLLSLTVAVYAAAVAITLWRRA